MDVIWQQKAEGLCTSLEFPDFLTTMAFVQEVAEAAEKMQHHPEWRNVYRRLDICLCTHDAGNRITEKDYALCAEINRILSSYQYTNQ
jgi:4a-hydroxytetrahydrobiopterin dehydratase